jgi:hypothetical protein
MKRKIYTNLLKWKDSPGRFPLLLKGARQVGKSYILQEFGENEYPDHHIFNFEQDRKLSAAFGNDLNPERIISELSIHSGKRINIDKDLVIFDEIQECPGALTSLKYFYEKMPQLALCCAGSLIGIKLSTGSFPVGKVDLFNLHPMSFEEFLMALNDAIALELYQHSDSVDTHSEIVHQKLWGCLREYYVTGGMPHVVSTYLTYRDDPAEAMKRARYVQKKLVEGYNNDFAKHSGKTNSMHIVSVFENVPVQLSTNIEGSVRRYRFKGVIPRKKGYAELQGPIDWLEKAGLIIKVKVCKKAGIPLESFCRNNMFKLLLFDIGLLGCMLDLPVNLIYSQDYGTAKGYFAENFVAQEFTASGVSKLYSWTQGASEIEFLRVINEALVPVEVKSGTRTQAKSLRQYILKYSPKRAVKISAKPLNRIKGRVLQNYPLYLSAKL